MIDPAPEFVLLRAALYRDIFGDIPDHFDDDLFAGINWDHLLWLGRQHGILLQLRDALLAHPPTSPHPAAILRQLEVLRQTSHLRALARARELSQLQGIFDEHSIKTVPVDRLLMGIRADGTPPLVEPSAVIPCLVAADDQDRAVAAVEAAGYPTKVDARKLIKLGKSPVLLAAHTAGKLPIELFIGSTTNVSLGGRSVRNLTRVHWLLLCAAEYSIHHDPLLRAWEIAKLTHALAAVDWAAVRTEAHRVGQHDTLAVAVRDSHRALGLPLPASVAETLGPLASESTPLASASSAADRPVVRVPFLPTPLPVMDRMLELAEPTSDDVVYDLGCGDGRFVIQAAKLYGARGVGVDIDPELVEKARAQAAVYGVSHLVSFVCSDIFETDLSAASVICLYLMPPFYPRLHEKLKREARSGTRIVSHDYIFPGWPPEKSELIRATGVRVAQLYLWRLP